MLVRSAFLGDADGVSRALVSAPLAVEFVLNNRHVVPKAPGLYAWWVRHGAMAQVPSAPHPDQADYRLLYIGISPTRSTSRQTIHSRVIGNHLTGNIGSSTFRFTLAALLVDELDLHPIARQTKLALNADDNGRLSSWQRENLGLTWCERGQPWEVEPHVIEIMKTPLNSATNARHPYYAHLTQARAELRKRAAAIA